MAANPRPVANPEPEKFEPITQWAREPKADVLIVFLPGFTKDQLKVQVASTGKLRISGERPIENEKRSRFEKELPLPSNCNTNEISARFEKGYLSIRLPSKIAPPSEPPPQPKPKTPPVSPIPHKPTNDQPPQAPKNKKEEEHVFEEDLPKTSIEKPKIVNDAPKKTAAAEEKDVVPKKTAAAEEKESPSDRVKEKSAVVDSMDDKSAAKVDKTTEGTVKESGKPGLVKNFREFLGGLRVDMKEKPKKLMNLVAVVVLVVVIVMSANSAIRYLVEFNTNDAAATDDQA